MGTRTSFFFFFLFKKMKLTEIKRVPALCFAKINYFTVFRATNVSLRIQISKSITCKNQEVFLEE